MDERIQELLDEAEMKMDDAISFLENQLTKVRAGKASPEMLDDVLVDYYGTPTPINQVGNVSAPDPRLLTVTPWEKNMIPAIDRAIRESNLGLNPTSDSDMVRVPIPSLNEERRVKLVKQAKDEAEQARISLRTVRRDVIASLKKLQKDGIAEDEVKASEAKVQELTDASNKKAEAMIKDKEKQIMTV
jgi:ribosome recycling factor